MNLAEERLEQDDAQNARKPPSPLSRRAIAALNLLRTTAYLRRNFAELVEPHGITNQQYNVLRVLRGAGLQGLPTLEITERMIEQTPGITRLLDRLEKKKLVRRERPLHNRRQVVCYVTPKGLELLKKLDEPVRENSEKRLRMLGEEEIEALIRITSRILEAAKPAGRT